MTAYLVAYINPLPHNDDFCKSKNHFDNIVKKRRKCCYLTCPHFPTKFSTKFTTRSMLSAKFNYSSANAFNLAKNYSLVKTRICLTLFQTSHYFYMSKVQVYRKHCGKMRNCSSRAISPFPSVFSTNKEKFLPSSSNLELSSANSLSWEASKIYRLGKV